MSDEFQVNVDSRQGTALSPLLFILVMELISRKKMYTDDRAMVAESKQELQGGHILPETGINFN